MVELGTYRKAENGQEKVETVLPHEVFPPRRILQLTYTVSSMILSALVPEEFEEGQVESTGELCP